MMNCGWHHPSRPERKEQREQDRTGRDLARGHPPLHRHGGPLPAESVGDRPRPLAGDRGAGQAWQHPPRPAVTRGSSGLVSRGRGETRTRNTRVTLRAGWGKRGAKGERMRRQRQITPVSFHIQETDTGKFQVLKNGTAIRE